MKLRKQLSVAIVAVLLLAAVGCATKANTSVPAPPPPGSINAVDAKLNQTLQPIDAFVRKMVDENNTGQITLTANQKSLLNQLGSNVNAADAIYLAWRQAGATAPTTQVDAAIAKAQASQNALNASIQGGK